MSPTSLAWSLAFTDLPHLRFTSHQIHCAQSWCQGPLPGNPEGILLPRPSQGQRLRLLLCSSRAEGLERIPLLPSPASPLFMSPKPPDRPGPSPGLPAVPLRARQSPGVAAPRPWRFSSRAVLLPARLFGSPSRRREQMFGRRSARSHQPTITRHRDSAEERKGGGSAQLLGRPWASPSPLHLGVGGGGRPSVTCTWCVKSTKHAVPASQGAARAGPPVTLGSPDRAPAHSQAA